MSASSVCLAELFLWVLVTLGEEMELLRLVELELMILLARGWTCSSELVLQEEKEELLCFLDRNERVQHHKEEPARWSNCKAPPL